MSMPSFQSFAPLIADCLQTHNVNLANENNIEMDVDVENEEIDGNGNDDSMSTEDNTNENLHDSNEVDVAGYVHENVDDFPPVFIQSNDNLELFECSFLSDVISTNSAASTYAGNYVVIYRCHLGCH